MDFLTPQSGNFFNGYFSDPWILDPYHEVLFFRNKKETKSYIEISESLGVDEPSDILFVTDVYQEAVAAKIAGTVEPNVLTGCTVQPVNALCELD